ISDELNYTKPDIEIFKKVEKSLNYKADEILYVGDDLRNDIIGSKEAGWKSLFLNVDEVEDYPSDIQEVKNFHEVIELFK
ncbi:MAG: HAD-IA family hydrolase, partial [Atopostipes sp.]|nr:HAD-IA family hydrolase [Atopostipes sp.]